MSISSLSGVAERVLTGFVQNAATAGTSRQAFSSLFLPENLRDSTSNLSSTELVAMLLGSRRSLSGLSRAAERLDLANPLSLFYGASATSSDTSKVTASIFSGISLESRPQTATYTLTVSQVAIAQSNLGTALASNSTNGFTAGTNTARFVQNGVTTDVDFAVGTSDNNATVLNNFAAAVNSTSGLGVAASVQTDALGGTSRLLLSSRYTGTANTFSVSNVAGSPVTNAGVNAATTSAQNASYALDGTALSSNSNDIHLGDYANLKLTLLAATTEAVTVSVKPDSTRLGNAIGGLADAFNETQSFYTTYQDANPWVSSQLSTIADRLRSDLEAIGIRVGSSGTLSVDGDELRDAISRRFGTVQRVIAEPRGLAPESRSVADVMMARPAAEISPLPGFQVGYAPQLLAGTYAARLDGIRLTGLLVDALT